MTFSPGFCLKLLGVIFVVDLSPARLFFSLRILTVHPVILHLYLDVLD